MQTDVFTEYVLQYSDMVYRMLRLYQSGKEFRDEEHIKAWLIRVAVNRSKDVLRSHKRKHTAELTADIPQPQQENGLDEALCTLGEDYRLAVYLHYYEGYGVREIASIMRISESNVKIRLKRARDKLKAFLTDE